MFRQALKGMKWLPRSGKTFPAVLRRPQIWQLLGVDCRQTYHCANGFSTQVRNKHSQEFQKGMSIQFRNSKAIASLKETPREVQEVSPGREEQGKGHDHLFLCSSGWFKVMIHYYLQQSGLLFLLVSGFCFTLLSFGSCHILSISHSIKLFCGRPIREENGLSFAFKFSSLLGPEAHRMTRFSNHWLARGYEMHLQAWGCLVIKGMRERVCTHSHSRMTKAPSLY